MKPNVKDGQEPKRDNGRDTRERQRLDAERHQTFPTVKIHTRRKQKTRKLRGSSLIQI